MTQEGGMNNFAREHKSASSYIDVAANDHGDEKGYLVRHALARLSSPNAHVVEIGPGGGAAVRHLASHLRTQPRSVHMTLIEAPGVVSKSLTDAMDYFDTVGTSALVHGWAQDLSTLIPMSADIISASALMHEVYSYGSGYADLYALIRALPTALAEYGFFAYRDVYSVHTASLHDRTIHTYTGQPWLQFLQMFTPHYLDNGRHPYHRSNDEPVARQNSQIVALSSLDDRVAAVIEAPIGLFREVQRHYVTMRDHVWRSGVLGFTPVLDGQLSNDWVDFRAGHKRVHFSFSDSARMSSAQRANLRALSESYGDHFVIDGDIFDAITDLALADFLTAAAGAVDETCVQVWGSWLEREGRETYVYLTRDELLTEFAVNSIEAGTDGETVLMPVHADDVSTRTRAYYNRYLSNSLANPLIDAKQLVLFQNIPITDSVLLQSALSVLGEHCTKPSLARVMSAVWRS
ncbi:hypothetical protein [Nocardia aurea]|uniref:hypothetical protein n=1 Tax=Nocardia aurea TaxID=2144174 RepID=UPI000D68D6CB|nr:hypothetical protein [Nocardia aurea]